MRLLTLLVASCVLVAKATPIDTVEKVTTRVLEENNDGKSVNTTYWNQNYSPGEVGAEADGIIEERSSISGATWPTSRGTVPLSAPKLVTPERPFNGGMKTFKRSNVRYASNKILTKKNAVFVIQAGGTLRNVIIAGGGGVFCETHNCALVNVWFTGCVQGALVVNSGTGITTITGGGAKNVAHRIIYGQASGTVVVSDNFYMQNSGRLFESCGTCGPVKRGIIVDGVVSVNPLAEMVRVNQNYHDMATISKAKIMTATPNYAVCARFNGGPAPKKVGTGVKAPVCSYTTADVAMNYAVQSA